jgi:hypothetical protein
LALKSVFAAALCAGLLMAGGPALADEYRADEFLGMDLSKALLSPKRLGPETEFAPVAIQAKTDHAQVQPKVEQKTERKVVRTTRVKQVAPRVALAPAVKPHAAARAKLARRSNPLDAQARDTRIQTWPCKSGGICNWQR